VSRNVDNVCVLVEGRVVEFELFLLNYLFEQCFEWVTSVGLLHKSETVSV